MGMNLTKREIYYLQYASKISRSLCCETVEKVSSRKVFFVSREGNMQAQNNCYKERVRGERSPTSTCKKQARNHQPV